MPDNDWYAVSLSSPRVQLKDPGSTFAYAEAAPLNAFLQREQ
jgi:hypothetical protein